MKYKDAVRIINPDHQKQIIQVAALVSELNERGLETSGCAAWWFQGSSEHVQVFLFDKCIWDSGEDDREQTGVCRNCNGKGKVPIPVVGGEIKIPEPDDEVDPAISSYCGVCGGTGTDLPYEPLEEYLPRAAFEHALEIIEMTRPRQDLEESMPHDKVNNVWRKLLEEGCAKLSVNKPPKGMVEVRTFVPEALANQIRKGFITGYSMGAKIERVVGVDIATGPSIQVETALCCVCGKVPVENGFDTCEGCKRG